MRIVLCEQDVFMLDIIEGLLARTGHELVGIADSAMTLDRLIEAARPDAVIFDIAVSYDSDFDIIATTLAVGARPIVFSTHAEVEVLSSYAIAPTVVRRPDVTALEQVLLRLVRDDDLGRVVETDRRRGPRPTTSGHAQVGLGDGQAFFEAVSDARPGDALVSIAVTGGADGVASDLAATLRGTDRILATSTSVRLYVPLIGEEGTPAFLRRIEDRRGAAWGEVTSVVVNDGERGTDAYERLRRGGVEAR